MSQCNYKIAYFSSELGISESLPTYSGGLGVLVGNHIKAAAATMVKTAKQSVRPIPVMTRQTQNHCNSF